MKQAEPHMDSIKRKNLRLSLEEVTSVTYLQKEVRGALSPALPH